MIRGVATFPENPRRVRGATGPGNGFQDIIPSLMPVAGRTIVIVRNTLSGCWPRTERVLKKIPAEELPGHVLLYGRTGTGKTNAAQSFGVPDGQSVISVNMHYDISAAELRGHYITVGGNFRFQMGPCLRAWRGGFRLVINEIEKASGDSHSFLLSILDDRDVAVHHLPSGKVIRPKHDFRVVATSNANPDELEPALRDRFPITIHIDRTHPDALARLDEDIRPVAMNLDLVTDPARWISVRSWYAFQALRRRDGDEVAAAFDVFGPRAADILAALKLARAG